jgi:hypothetical protein
LFAKKVVTMHETLIGEDFAYWPASSDAYAQQISQVCLDGTIVQNGKLLLLSQDLQAMDLPGS